MKNKVDINYSLAISNSNFLILISKADHLLKYNIELLYWKIYLFIVHE